jgi:hypothetical protein
MAEELQKRRAKGKLSRKLPRSARWKRLRGLLWTFVNSGFALFLFSSVIVALFSWSYQQFAARLEAERESQKNYQKLSLEVMNRLNYLTKLQGKFKYEERRVIIQALYGFDPGANVNPSWIIHYSSVFPEYQQRSLESLLWELERLSDTSHRQTFQMARQRIKQLPAYFDKLEYTEIDGKGKGPDKKIGIFSLGKDDSERLRTEIIEPISFLNKPDYDLNGTR